MKEGSKLTRFWQQKGFTLVEILVVIAVLGILSIVLLAVVYQSRVQAQERAAQAYSAGVAKALTAVLTTDSSLTPEDVAGGTFNCGAGAPATTQVVIDGVAYEYGWSAAPGSVTACTVAPAAIAPMIDVEITTELSTYVNGANQ